MNGADEPGANQRVALYNLQPLGERQMWLQPQAAVALKPKLLVAVQLNPLPWSVYFPLNVVSYKSGSCSVTVGLDSMIVVIANKKIPDKMTMTIASHRRREMLQS